MQHAGRKLVAGDRRNVMGLDMSPMVPVRARMSTDRTRA
jgi:hypothetical protein